MRSTVFTINNWTNADVSRILYLQAEDKIRYVVYGKEVGASGTPHLQGFVQFSKEMRYNTVKKWFPRAHFEPVKGTPQQASDYCKKGAQSKEEWKELKTQGPNYGKDADVYEWGNMTNQGSRTDIKDLYEYIKNGYPLFEVMEEFPELYAKYHSAIEKMYHMVTYDRNIKNVAEEFTDITWRPWQQELLSILAAKPQSRDIHWYYDEVGNNGKSFIVRYLLSQRKTYLITGGSKADIFYAYNYEPIVLLDLSRDCQDKQYIYDVMENFWNGQFLSTKYNSHLKVFPQPHVVVFANFRPNKIAMSLDRWVIHTL